MQMPGRKYNGGDYCYGFGGHENDNEVKGDGNHLDFGGYGYDSRLGRRLNVDPLAQKYPNQSPYTYSNNSPILYTDPDGEEGIIIINTKDKTVLVVSTYIVEIGESGFDKGGFFGFERLDDKLNAKNYTVTDKKSAYYGYNVSFDFNFMPMKGENKVTHYARNEDKLSYDKAIVGDETITNGILLKSNFDFDQLDRVKEIDRNTGRKADGLTDTTGEHIVLPTRSVDDDVKKIHEIFHTLYFDKDGSVTVGIGSGHSLPNQNEINELIKGFIKEKRVVNSEDVNYEKEVKK